MVLDLLALEHLLFREGKDGKKPTIQSWQQEINLGETEGQTETDSQRGEQLDEVLKSDRYRKPKVCT